MKRLTGPNLQLNILSDLTEKEEVLAARYVVELITKDEPLITLEFENNNYIAIARSTDYQNDQYIVNVRKFDNNKGGIV